MTSTNTPRSAWGVDGCKAGWFYFRLPSVGDITFGVVTKLRALFDPEVKTAKDKVTDTDIVTEGDLMLVDMPIGLPDRVGLDGRKRETAFRTCDKEARDRLEDRKSSVFPVPVRPVMEALRDEMGLRVPPKNEKEKKRRQWGNVRQVLDDAELTVGTGEGRITAQSFAILPKIIEVDDLLHSSDKACSIVRETHPEVCFRVLVGDDRKERLSTFSKKHGLGFLNRVAIVESCHPGARSAIFNACEEWPHVASDDIVDAMACAVMARLILDESGSNRSLGDDPPEDEKGLPMQIVLASRDAVQRARAAATASGAP